MISKAADTPTATAHEHRLRIFQATRRPKLSTSKTIRTAHGQIKITGKLGQAHADILDAICFCAEKRGETEDGRIKLLVDPAKVRRAANIASGQGFESLIDGLLAAVVEIKEPARLSCIGHLVDHIDTATRSDGSEITRHNPLTGGERPLWRVELGKAFCKLIAADVVRTYDPAPVARLASGVAQAVARFTLSHQHQPVGGWRLDTLLDAVAGEDLDDVSRRHRRRELRRDGDGLRKIGIILDGDRIKMAN